MYIGAMDCPVPSTLYEKNRLVPLIDINPCCLLCFLQHLVHNFIKEFSSYLFYLITLSLTKYFNPTILRQQYTSCIEKNYYYKKPSKLLENTDEVIFTYQQL